MVVAPGAGAWSALARRARRLPVAAAVREGRWLILAPHPDDETLGPGALIAALAAAGTPPVVAFLTDGSGSHVGAPGWTGARIARVRRGEAREALRALGVVVRPVALGWTDAAPMTAAEPGFMRSAGRLAAVCRRHRVARILVTWDAEPHCDHAAAAALARIVGRRCRLPVLEYLVWGWTRADLRDRLRARAAVSIATAAHRPAQRRAMARHRTQRGGRIAGGESFRLPSAMLRLIDRPLTLLLEPDHAS